MLSEPVRSHGRAGGGGRAQFELRLAPDATILNAQMMPRGPFPSSTGALPQPFPVPGDGSPSLRERGDYITCTGPVAW